MEPCQIILSMIVCNESLVIERCLQSVDAIVDDYVIVDTGSKDDTVAKIQRWNKPGQIFFRPFENFGTNRTHAYQCIFKYLQQKHETNLFCAYPQLPSLPLIAEYSFSYSKKNIYVLLIDADMILSWSDSHAIFKWRTFLCSQARFQPGFYLKQIDDKTKVVSYNIRLLHLAQSWFCQGLTHESWIYTENQNIPKLDDPFLIDYEDGGCKANKYERDIFLLKQSLEDERSFYYLGQSYHQLGQLETALYWYTRRSQSQSKINLEEKWHASFMMGIMNLKLGRSSAMEQCFLAAFQERPTRIEPLFVLMQQYRQQQRYNEAKSLLEKIRQIPFPSQDSMFIESQFYGAGLIEEMAILYRFFPECHRLGWEACEKLKFGPLITFRKNSLLNELYYIQPLPHQIVYTYDNHDQIQSCISHGSTIYLLTQQGHYIELQESKTLIMIKKINLEKKSKPLALFWHQGEIWFYRTLGKKHHFENWNQEKKSEYPWHFQHQKQFYVIENLCPIHLIASDFPIYRLTENLEGTILNLSALESFTIQSAPLRWQNGFLLLVRESWNNLYFFHRFLWFDKCWLFKKMSLPFFLCQNQHEKIQHCVRYKSGLLLILFQTNKSTFHYIEKKRIQLLTLNVQGLLSPGFTLFLNKS